jgi:hypothetical protein
MNADLRIHFEMKVLKHRKIIDQIMSKPIIRRKHSQYQKGQDYGPDPGVAGATI